MRGGMRAAGIISELGCSRPGLGLLSSVSALHFLACLGEILASDARGTRVMEKIRYHMHGELAWQFSGMANIDAGEAHQRVF